MDLQCHIFYKGIMVGQCPAVTYWWQTDSVPFTQNLSVVTENQQMHSPHSRCGCLASILLVRGFVYDWMSSGMCLTKATITLILNELGVCVRVCLCVYVCVCMCSGGWYNG